MVIYLRLLGYIKPQITLVIFTIVLSFFISTLHFASLAIFKPIGDCLFAQDLSVSEQLLALGSIGEKIVYILGEDFVNDRYNVVYVSVCFMAIVIVLKNMLRFTHDYVSNYIANTTLISIVDDTFDKIIHANMVFFNKKSSAHAINLLHRQIAALSIGIRLIFGKVQREPLKILVSLAICFSISWSLSLFIFAMMPVVMFVVYYFGKKIREKLQENIQEDGVLLSIFQDIFHGVYTLKTFSMESFFHNKLQCKQRELLHKRMQLAKYDFSTGPVVEVLVSISGILVLLVSARMVLKKQMTPGDFFMFYAAVAVMVDPIRKLAGIHNKIVRCTTIGQKVFALQDEAVYHSEKNDGKYIFSFQDKIEFDKVSFAYKREIVLKRVSFEVTKGEKVGVFGYNGSGKSTMGKILLKFFVPRRGEVRVDGKSLQEYDTESLRQKISVVSQKSHLFHLSLWDNICCGKSKDEKAVQSIARSIAALDFILESGFDAVYGKDIEFSGGQEQLLTIVRGLTKASDIIILDEATASLDKENEKQTREYIKDYCKEKTLFIISHKESTLDYVDKIIVFNKGEVECWGTKDFVLQNSQVLRNLFQDNKKQNNV
ncbi:ABC transporter ATP-binding protein [Candidatus Uabimicrobium amorphum]|nr:ABC transporter ATP-binding protein [Candidatus Uabimicrobium amorphum]